MKTLIPILLVLAAGSALAGGSAYYFTSRVYIAGPSDWGALQPGASYQNDYAIGANYSDLVGVSISGDPEFSIDASACSGTRSCTATVSFLADVGGDYAATITGTSSSVCCRISGSSKVYPITAHVVGANYTLAGVDNGNATATFTLSSTGETDLLNTTFAASTYADLGPPLNVTSNTCGEDIPPGTSCQVVVSVAPTDEAAGGYVYVLLQAYGNTRQQDPARVTLVLPRAPDSIDPTPIIVDPTPIIVDGPAAR